MSWFRPCVRPMFRYFVILNRRPLAPSELPEFTATMDVSDSRSTMPDSSLVRLVLRCHPLGRRCTGSPWLPCSLNVRLELVSDPGVFERTCHDARPNIACGRRKALGLTQLPYFRGSIHSGAASPATFSPRLLSWLRIDRPVARSAASLDTKPPAQGYLESFPLSENMTLPGRTSTLRVGTCGMVFDH